MRRRETLRATLVEAARRELFMDMRAVREFEDFLDSAVDAAGSGGKIARGWRSSIQNI